MRSPVPEFRTVGAMEALWPISDLQLHPRADLVPPMTEQERDDLYADIVVRGISVPLDVLADGTVLDGRHRYGIATALGLAEVPVRVVETDDAEAYMLRAALLRRQLTTKQRKAIAKHLLDFDPVRSDRQVAAATGLSDKTVASVRRDLEFDCGNSAVGLARWRRRSRAFRPPQWATARAG